MNLIDRAKNIIIAPNKEWDLVATEQPDIGKIITNYVLPLAGAAAVAAFIGYALIGVNLGPLGIRVRGFNWALFYAIETLAGALIAVFLNAFIIDAIAPSFGAEKNMGRSVQLVAYSYTPMWIGGLLAILPMIAFLGALFGIYGLYLMYIGLPKLKKVPVDKQAGYFIVAIVIMIVVYFLIAIVMNRVLMPGMGLHYGRRGLFFP